MSPTDCTCPAPCVYHPTDFGQQWIGDPWKPPTRAQEFRFWVLTAAFSIGVALSVMVLVFGWFR